MPTGTVMGPVYQFTPEVNVMNIMYGLHSWLYAICRSGGMRDGTHHPILPLAENGTI